LQLSPSPKQLDVPKKLRLRPTVLSDSPSPIASLPPRAGCRQSPNSKTPRCSPRVLHREMSKAFIGLGLGLPCGQSLRAASFSSAYFSHRPSSVTSTPSPTCSPHMGDTQKLRLRPMILSDSPSPIIQLPRRRMSYKVPVGLGIDIGL